MIKSNLRISIETIDTTETAHKGNLSFIYHLYDDICELRITLDAIKIYPALFAKCVFNLVFNLKYLVLIYSFVGYKNS